MKTIEDKKEKLKDFLLDFLMLLAVTLLVILLLNIINGCSDDVPAVSRAYLKVEN